MTQISPSGPIELDPRIERQDRPQPTDSLRPIVIGTTTDKVTYIADNLPKPLEDELVRLLFSNADLFAWILADMLGIDPDFACHSLAIDPSIKPVSQRRENSEKKDKQQ